VEESSCLRRATPWEEIYAQLDGMTERWLRDGRVGGTAGDSEGVPVLLVPELLGRLRGSLGRAARVARSAAPDQVDHKQEGQSGRWLVRAAIGSDFHAGLPGFRDVDGRRDG
jgi:hypothetical protein